MPDQNDDRRPIEFLRRSLLRDFTEMSLHYYAVPPPILERLVANRGRWPVGYSNGQFWCRPITKGGFELPEPFREIRMGSHSHFDPDFDPEVCTDEAWEKLELFWLHLSLYDPDLL